MGLALILPLPNSALSRARFFRSYGVALEAPARSRSGVRADDGMVVFALPAARVSVDAWGCSCLLWTVTDRLGDRAGSDERLRHCRLAVRHGVAEDAIDRVWVPGASPRAFSSAWTTRRWRATCCSPCGW